MNSYLQEVRNFLSSSTHKYSIGFPDYEQNNSFFCFKFSQSKLFVCEKFSLKTTDFKFGISNHRKSHTIKYQLFKAEKDP